MPREKFAHVDTWVFDLDNTLYPAECHLFSQIDARMSTFIEGQFNCSSEEARKIQKGFYVQYGTTLNGLMTEHNVAPSDFMDYVHDIDLSGISANQALDQALEALPGRKLIFTNGSVKHAENVAGKLGILDRFDDVFDIEKGGFTPKPQAEAYTAFMSQLAVEPSRAAMFEDLPQNLMVPHAAGMRTVLVQSDADWFADEPAGKRPARPGETFDHVHHVTMDLTHFLGELTRVAPSPLSD